MMKYLILAIIFFVSFGCSNKEKEMDRFLSAYEEVLIAREKYSADSLLADQKVVDALAKYDYTEPEFRKQYFEYAQDPQTFISALDSLRERVNRTLDSVRKQEAIEYEQKLETDFK